MLDALAVGKPIICSKTKGLGIDVATLGIGETYTIGDAQSLIDAYTKIDSNYSVYVSRIQEYTKTFNMKAFTKSLNIEFDKVLNGQYKQK